jgi:hypothetical protein
MTTHLADRALHNPFAALALAFGLVLLAIVVFGVLIAELPNLID